MKLRELVMDNIDAFTSRIRDEVMDDALIATGNYIDKLKVAIANFYTEYNIIVPPPPIVEVGYLEAIAEYLKDGSGPIFDAYSNEEQGRIRSTADKQIIKQAAIWADVTIIR